MPEPFPVYLIIVALSTHTSSRPSSTKMGGITDSISTRFRLVSSRDFCPISGKANPTTTLTSSKTRNIL